MRTILILICILFPFLHSCDAPVKTLGENPSISYYIVGRLKTIEIKDAMPFKVKAFRLSAQLIEKPFRLKIISLEQFELFYVSNNLEIRTLCSFGKEMNDEHLHLVISAEPALKKDNLEVLKYIDYEFQVKGEERK